MTNKSFYQIQDWAKAPPEHETMEMDLEKSGNGYGANLNVDTSQTPQAGGQLPEENSALMAGQQQAGAGAAAYPDQHAKSANPFTSGQTSNPFRQGCLL